MRLTHLGHACLLAEFDDARLLIDPGVFSQVSAVHDVDAVLITHQHPDHIDLDRVRQVLAANPRATLVVDEGTATAVRQLPAHRVVAVGERLHFGSSVVDVVGGEHALVHRDMPRCVNVAYLVDDGAFLHPGDSFHVPDVDVDVLAAAIDGPWLKIAETVDYVRAVAPRVAVPMHEAEATDPAKYVGMLDTLTGGGVVHRLVIAEEEQL
jgi:L-ascorbate metabolism protein UlaG (beta-lactamase superfamily)